MSQEQSGKAPLIEVRDVERVYHQGEVEVRALRGVNLRIEAGEFSALAGPSGSGKTTLLNMVGCLDSPTSGEVLVEGEAISGMTRSEAAEYRLGHIGFVFQAYNLIPVLTAWENAEFVLLMQGVGLEERHSILDPLFERVGLADYKDRKPHEMSGGQQQRVAVVRALGSRPKIVLADEPTANLDSATSASLLELMAELNEERGVTFVFSTHDEMVIERAHRVVRLDSGCVVGDERRDV
ncbi:macrolide ABC transporter ATP-binding protein [Lujinxingia litoralis]|uniref:Macrolide ABC transporter ATP-binding protein n=1 Tax=Lujinxingia litoralis TaxID=2211119 RepID=A0A328C753_9DELT|nr:ABC transporter ATP-binding protein [Lujinxingia litoralis]RAL22882.1 macrolide ABC transporter ATP-binding protein [Lujinxingia litoralis]